MELAAFDYERLPANFSPASATKEKPLVITVKKD